MFHSIPEKMQNRMSFLSDMDKKDRIDGTLRLERLRQIPPATGKFIAMMAANVPKGDVIEIGTSAGYSTMWLMLACKESQRKIITYEIMPEKILLAKETFLKIDAGEKVELIEGDAREYINGHKEIAFCFLDAEKDVYRDCYDLAVPRLVKGGILIADNAINHRAALGPMIEFAMEDHRVDAMVNPIGNGVLVCRKC